MRHRGTVARAVGPGLSGGCAAVQCPAVVRFMLELGSWLLCFPCPSSWFLELSEYTFAVLIIFKSIDLCFPLHHLCPEPFPLGILRLAPLNASSAAPRPPFCSAGSFPRVDSRGLWLVVGLWLSLRPQRPRMVHLVPECSFLKISWWQELTCVILLFVFSMLCCFLSLISCGLWCLVEFVVKCLSSSLSPFLYTHSYFYHYIKGITFSILKWYTNLSRCHSVWKCAKPLFS